MTADHIAPPVLELFPDRASRERVEDHLTRALADAAERVLRGPVMPDLDVAELHRELAACDFTRPRPLEALVDWTIGQLEHGTVHMMHPRYFGLFNPPPNFPAQCADRISGAFNPQLASSGSSPAPVAIEQHVIHAFAQRAGLPPESAGHFTSSGSEANYTALVCALTHADPRFADEGVRAFDGPVAMYTSRECQPAWHKIAHQAGIGRSALKLIATDGGGRMNARALAEAIRHDRRHGIVPVLISATAGTTGAGMIDPLEPCATIARECNIWYHVDAAWG
ncbi:MAG: pyridoxal phosphate-dependent decarboxylase family protein, partial [Steroidobacteraceae bacterium]